MSGGGVALIIIFLLIALAVGGFFGYKYYKKRF
jgi:predicted negative regulator of RcsB-dependent stress response